VVQDLPRFDDANLLVGPEHFSDAGVYRLRDGLALVQTVDFFPPVVDDPFVFGQIAAANALSDVYAMGGRPVTAMNLVGFPEKDLPLSILAEILRGGAERVLAAGAVIVGGHSVRDAEIKYGLSVTGVVDPARMMTNAAARPGDAIVLTKALGTGFITTALRKEQCPQDTLDAAVASMIALNREASEIAVEHGAKAATDITGFGLAGHAAELARASGVTIRLRLESLPLIPGAEELAVPAYFTSANNATRQHLGAAVRFEGDAESIRARFLFDPQTSGGLLIALPAAQATALVSAVRAAGAEHAAIIGEAVAKQADADLLVTG
jgi:selenide,water dikinase